MPEVTDQLPVPASDDAAKPSYGTVLIIEDIAVMRRVLKQCLEEANYQVLEAADASDAATMFVQQEVHAIVCDITLPGMSGIDFLRRIKMTGKGKNVPVVMCTAIDHKRMVIEAMKAGAEGYIVKPFERIKVVQKMDQVLKVTRS